MVGVAALGSETDGGTVRHWFIVNESNRSRAEALAEKFATERYTLSEPVDGYDAIAAIAPLPAETIDRMGVAPSGVVFSGTVHPVRFL